MSEQTSEELRELQEQLARGEASDGYHTHRELYEYRMLYNAHAARGWLAAGIPVVKSRRHSDGELCFGGGWFVVVAMLATGQVTNHYREEHWSLFDVPEAEKPPEYDGHTPEDAADRLRGALALLPVAPVVGEREAEPAGWLREFRPDGWSNWMPNGLYLVPPPAPVSPDVRDVPLYRAARTPEEGKRG